MLKQIIITLVFLGLTTNAYAGISQRKNSQSQRIENGVNSGELTEAEAKNLNRGQEKVDRKSDRVAETKDAAKADGHIDQSEKRKIISQKVNLRRTQQRQSERINNKKHNERSR